MISFDFDYYKPSSIYEAVSLYQSLSLQGLQPLYYAGGTEIITLARVNQLYTNAVIDLKGIPECNVFELRDGALIIGATITLSQIAEANHFPLLSETAEGAADQTARNKITIGGNICGKIKYKEAILPLLLSDSVVVLAGKAGLRQAPIDTIFDKHLQLTHGECIIQFVTDEHYLHLPYRSIKKRKIGSVGYPLLTVAALHVGDRIRFAFSGLCEFPFRSLSMEERLNDSAYSIHARIENALELLPAPILNDQLSSAAYRRYILCLLLEEILVEFENGGEDLGYAGF